MVGLFVLSEPTRLKMLFFVGHALTMHKDVLWAQYLLDRYIFI